MPGVSNQRLWRLGVWRRLGAMGLKMAWATRSNNEVCDGWSQFERDEARQGGSAVDPATPSIARRSSFRVPDLLRSGTPGRSTAVPRRAVSLRRKVAELEGLRSFLGGHVRFLNGRQVPSDAPGDPGRGALDRVPGQGEHTARSSAPAYDRVACRSSVGSRAEPAPWTQESGVDRAAGDSSVKVAGQHPYRISAAMLSAIRSAVSWIESCARWA